MARCVIIVDSETGKLVDVAGNVREGGRYRKFIGRMLSSDRNPMLDYGANGGSKLEISDGGYAGDEIDLKARLVNISGDLRVGGVTLAGTGKLDSEAAYPAWNSETAYVDRTVVSHIGMLWMADGDIAAGVEPGADADEEDNGESGSDEPGTWQSITIGDLIDEAGHGSGDIEVVPPSQDATTGQAADAKATGDALYTGFTEWEFSGDGYIEGHTYTIVIDSSEEEGYYDYMLYDNGNYVDLVTLSTDSSIGIDFNVENITATRHLVTPTKTSQLTNDGPSSGPNVGHPFATTNQIPAPVDISGKLDGAAAYPVWNDTSEGWWPPGTIVSWKGKLYRTEEGTAFPGEPGTPEGAADWAEITIQSLLAAKANASDVATALAQKVSFADLPYAMVTPGEWEFSDGLSHEITGPREIYGPDEEPGGWIYQSSYNGVTYYSQNYKTEALALATLEITFSHSGDSFTATRPSLPGHLLDRANNLIDATTGDVTLTLPAYQEGKVRDLLVHIDLGDDGTNPYTVTVNFPSGETNTGFKVKGNASAPFPAPDVAGEWLYSFSECAPHKMAVSLVQLQDATVAGGS